MMAKKDHIEETMKALDAGYEELLKAVNADNWERTQESLKLLMLRTADDLESKGLSPDQAHTLVTETLDGVMIRLGYDPDGGDGCDDDPDDSRDTAFLIFSDDKDIKRLESGEINGNHIQALLRDHGTMRTVGSSMGVNLILSDLGKRPSAWLDIGRMVKESKAYMPERIHLRTEDGIVAMRKPMVLCHNADDVSETAALLSKMTEKEFLKKASPKNLHESGWFETWLDGSDDLQLSRNEAPHYLLDQFTELRKAYKDAAEQKKGMITMTMYTLIDADTPEPYSVTELNAVDEHIGKHFGETDDGLTTDMGMGDTRMRVDIHLIPPSGNRDHITAVTSGAGVRLMDTDLDERSERAEFMILLPPGWDCEKDDWPTNHLFELMDAQISHGKRLGHGHTEPNDSENTAFAKDTELCGSILTVPRAFSKKAAVCELRCGDDVRFWQAVPLYASEMEYAEKNGAEALEALLPEEAFGPLNLKRKKAV